MSAFLYGIVLQWKLDLRNKEILLMYYVVPLIFFAFMGGIFTSINPMAKDTLIQSMTIFGVTMGAILGAPTPLVAIFGSEIQKAYKVGNIPLWVAAIHNFLSALIHLFLMSLVIFFAAPIVFAANVPANVLLYFVSLGIFIVTCLALGTVLGVFIKSSSKLTMASQFIFLPSIMLSGIMLPSPMLPEVLQVIGKFFPATWGFRMMTAESMDLSTAFPLIFITTLALCISGWKITQAKVD